MLELKEILKSKKGIGIAEVMVAAAVLGFLYVALSNLQKGNHEAFLRIRGRDGAVEVAQQVLDSLKSVGASAVPVNSDLTKDNVITLDPVERSWKRGLGGTVSVSYTPVVTVRRITEAAVAGAATTNTPTYVATSGSNFETVQHVYAKQVNVQVSWVFKGANFTVDVSGVVR